MIFNINEEKLEKRLKFYIPISFLIMACIAISTYSILLKEIYKQSSTQKIYVYIFMVILVLLIAVSIFFDCLKIEKGKYFPLGRVYIIKSALAVIIVAIVSYAIYILDDTTTIFEILNIRLIMVIFLINLAATLSAIFFNILAGPLYKKTGKREYYLPMVYSFLPASMATIIFIVTLVNGMHYRSELIYNNVYDTTLKKQYSSEFINELQMLLINILRYQKILYCI